MLRFFAEKTAAPATLFGEGPVWHNEAVWYCDLKDDCIYRFDPETHVSERFAFDQTIACLASADEGLVAGTSDGFALISEEGEMTPIVDVFSDEPRVRMNDGAVDRQGRFLSGSMAQIDGQKGRADLWQLGSDVPLMNGLNVANGMAFSPDGRIFYISDSDPDIQTVWRCDYNPDTGAVGARIPWLDFSDLTGRPDGATVDAQGGYWIAGIDGGIVRRFNQDGICDVEVILPGNKVTKPIFGGPHLSRMFITTATTDDTDGRLYAVDLPYSGIPSVPVVTAHLR